MKRLWNKLITILIAAAMAFCCMPAANVLAEENISQDSVEEYVSADEDYVSVDEEYDVSADEVTETVVTEEEPASETSSADGTYWPDGPYVEAECAILMDAATGAILYAKNVDQQMYPASITKIMTTLLALENSSMDETVTFSYDAVYKNEQDSSHIARDLDEEMTMEETLYAVMLESANECAYAVAEHVGGGDYQTFIDMMNERAAELGCTNTHFNNANGLPDEEHVTTARDMALIAREAIKNPEFRKIISTKQYTIPPTNKHDEPTYLNNHHRMLNNYRGDEYIYEYCIGGKTGYTQAAGNTLVTYSEKDGMLLITVVLNTTTPYDDSIALFEYGFNNFRYVNIATSETRYEGSSGSGNDMIFNMGDSFVELDSDAEIILPDSASIADTSVEVTYADSADDMLGTLTYTYDGRTVGTADVTVTRASGNTYEFGKETGSSDNNSGSGENLEESSRSRRGSERSMRRVWRRWLRWVVIIAIIVVVLLVIVRPILQQMFRRRRRKKRRKAQSGRSSGSSQRSSPGSSSGSGSRSGSGSGSRSSSGSGSRSSSGSGSRSSSGSSSRNRSGSSSKNRRR